jgi:DNA mismatch repair protein MutL
MPIRLLPIDVSSKIAAGEVIERPASVVKELLENSLDAGATEITIELAAGGIDEIRVVDNGSGIPAAEVELAFARFATSKLTLAEDLELVETLGFRGEALPSVAAVSDVEIVTRTAGEDQGTCAELSGGVVTRKGPVGAAAGTVITSRHLFKSLPARRKFLRTPAAEGSRVQTVTSRYALAYPATRFNLIIDGSRSFGTVGSGDLREVISDLYGSQVAHSMLALDPAPAVTDEARVVVEGMIGPPSTSRSNRSHITIFINGRWVQTRMLTYALQEAYRGFLMERRFPLAVVHITVPPDEVDVNVHPSKTEVRFRREGSVFSALQQAVRGVLVADVPVPTLEEQPAESSNQPAAPGHTTPLPARPMWPIGNPSAPIQSGALRSSGDHPASQLQEPLLPRDALPALRVLGQVQATYIAAEGPDGVYLIDQHAAHERVVFEKVLAQSAAAAPESQSLMEPAMVALDPRQSEMIASHGELVVGLGFMVEPFGDRTFIIRGVPALLSGNDPGQALVDVLESMAEGGGFESWQERAAYSMACHGAIRAGMSLGQQQMSELTRQLEGCNQSHTCPHGRPTMIHLTSARLEREFGRR